MKNNDANAEMSWLQDFPMEFFTKLSVENR